MKRRILSFLLCFVLVCSCSPSAYAIQPDPGDGPPSKAEALDKLRAGSGGAVEYAEEDGSVRLSGKLSGVTDCSQSAALRFLGANKALFDVSDPARELKYASAQDDGLGNTYVEFTQQIDGLPVEGGALNVRFDKAGVISNVFGYMASEKTVTKLGETEITPEQAIETAKAQFTFDSLKTEPQAVKLITQEGGKNYAAYRVDIHSLEPVALSYYVYVEIYSGQVIRKENRIRADGPAKSAGIDVQGNTRTLDVYETEGRYFMLNAANPAANGIYTYSFRNGFQALYAAFSDTGVFDTEEHKANVSAHYYADTVVDFYYSMFTRFSLDNGHMEVDSFTHYDNNYVNAFWDGYEIVYGDGDGVNYTYMCGDLDVVAHEFTHAVSDYEADFSYSNQSGALSESMSDVFGVLVETYDKYVGAGLAWQFDPADWVVGDELCLPSNPNRAIRSMAEPELYDQPGHMSQYQNLPDDENGDFGGVHVNSGILNKAAYLIAQKLGMEATARIYYYALRYYMGMYTDFDDALSFLKQAASALYGYNSQAVAAVSRSFGEVGIGSDVPPSADGDTYEPNDSKDTAYQISAGTAYRSRIMADGDNDYYKIYADGSQALHVELTEISGRCEITVLKSDGTALAHGANTDESRIILECDAASPGYYYIRVYANGTLTAPCKYTLTATTPAFTPDPYESNDTYDTAYTIVPGTEYQADLSSSTDKDYYTITVSGDTKIWLKLSGYSSLSMSLYSGDNTLIASSGNLGMECCFDYYSLNGGTYYIVVSSASVESTSRQRYWLHIYENFVPEDYFYLISTKANPINLGESIQLGYFISPENATLKNITWTSSDPDVITVDQQGNVKAHQVGSATITAYTQERRWKSHTTIVVEKIVTGISISIKPTYMFVGESITLPVKITPSDATNKSLTWNNNFDSIVSLDSSTGTVKAISPGYASVSVVSSNWLRDYCEIYVYSNASGMALDKTSATLSVGQSMQLRPTMYPLGAYSGTVSWSVDNAYVATVDKNGNVTGVSKGTATVYAKSENGGFVASCTVSVTTLPVPRISGAASSGYNSITVKWQPLSGASGYLVYRSDKLKGKYVYAGYSTGTSFNATGLTTGKAYYFKIGAYKTDINTVFSGYSGVVSAKPAPAAPAGVKASPISFNSIRVTWSAVAGATKYEVYRASSPGGKYKRVGSVKGCSFINKSVNTGAPYYYKVKAYRSTGRAYGPLSSAIGAARTSMGKPAWLTCKKLSPSSVKLAWGAVAGKTRYEIWRQVGPNGKFIYLTAVSGTSFTDKKLAAGVPYYYMVRAYRTVSRKKVYGAFTEPVGSIK